MLLLRDILYLIPKKSETRRIKVEEGVMFRIIPSRRQWASWTLPSKASYGAVWIGLVGLLLWGIQFLLFDGSKSVEIVEKEFEQVLHKVDVVQDEFREWLHPKSEVSPNCEVAGEIMANITRLLPMLSAFSDDQLGEIRITKSMAKHEYTVMLYSFAAAISETCPDLKLSNSLPSIEYAELVLAKSDTVRLIGNDLRSRVHDGEQDKTGLLHIADDIERITEWHVGRVTSILYLKGQVLLEDALKAVNTAYAHFPNKPDPFMDRVREIKNEWIVK